MRANRKKSVEALVVAFDSTASALAFDSAAKRAELSGRLCPVPRSLSVGCGLAWRGDPAAQPQVQSLIDAEDIDDARIVVMMLR